MANNSGNVNIDDKRKALDAAIAQIEKQYGKGSVMKLGDSNANMNIDVIPTGSLSLDIALGLGGVPRGRIIEVFGPESSGKTTVALHIVAEIQKRGGIAGFIDAEHALDPTYAKNIGVDIDNLYISQPDCGEQALEITETMVRSGAVDVVIVDSVAALVPKAEIDGFAYGTSCQTYVTGAQKAHCCCQQDQLCCHIYQSAQREGWSCVR